MPVAGDLERLTFPADRPEGGMCHCLVLLFPVHAREIPSHPAEIILDRLFGRHHVSRFTHDTPKSYLVGIGPFSPAGKRVYVPA